MDAASFVSAADLVRAVGAVQATHGWQRSKDATRDDGYLLFCGKNSKKFGSRVWSADFICAPDLVRPINGQMPKQIGPYPVLRMRLAGLRALVDRRQTHLEQNRLWASKGFLNSHLVFVVLPEFFLGGGRKGVLKSQR